MCYTPHMKTEHERWCEAYRKTHEGKAHDFQLKFADLIIKRLKDTDMSQKTLAQCSGITEPHLSNLINGQGNITAISIGKILAALEMDIELVVK